MRGIVALALESATIQLIGGPEEFEASLHCGRSRRDESGGDVSDDYSQLQFLHGSGRCCTGIGIADSIGTRA